MKKFIVSAALVAAVALGANAQESAPATLSYKFVSPVTIECMQFNTTELRDQAANQDAYIASLNALQKQLQAEKAAIENEQKQLKQERDLYNGLKDGYKDRKKQLEGLISNLKKEIETYESYQKDIKKQFATIKKMSNVSSEAIQNHTKFLADLEENYKHEEKATTRLKEDLEKNAQTEINNTFAFLNDFLLEITDKETRLKNLAAQNKTNLDIVKAAIKTANGK